MKTDRKQLLLILFILSIVLHPLKLCCYDHHNTTLVLNNPVDAGFGAIFSTVIAALDMYEQHAFGGVKVDLNSGIYLDPEMGPNYWEYFFEPIELGHEANQSKVFSVLEIFELCNTGLHMSRERAFELIQKYVHLKPNISSEIKKFTQNQFKNSFIIGVHHRGTDKFLEAPIVSWQMIEAHVNCLINNCAPNKSIRIFVATDDYDFLNYMKNKFRKLIICNDFIRSKNGYPLHYGNEYANNYQKGKEAIIDCLLLSKCHALIYPSASAFSRIATKFNPYQIVIPLRG